MLTPEQLRTSGEWLTTLQLPSGAIPWEPGRHADPWDHVESLMALSVAGLHDQARAGFRWLRDVQAADGSFASAYTEGVVTDATSQSGYCSYLVVGLWHHHAVTGDVDFLRELWPTAERALDWALTLEVSPGIVVWARDPRGRLDKGPLVTGTSSLLLALRRGVELAASLGSPRPDWSAAADRISHVLQAHPSAFMNRARYAMDWYYPILGGALRGVDADDRIDTGWEYFVRPSRGVRCVSDRPWFTPAETSELVMALDAVGQRDRGLALLAGGEKIREADGGIWTGWVDDLTETGELWPDERTSWTVAAVMLANDVVTDGSFSGSPAAAQLFRSVPTAAPRECTSDCPGALAGSKAWADALEHTQAPDVSDLIERP